MEANEASIYARSSVEDHPGRCRRCGTTIVIRTGLVGTLDSRPVCERCLLEAHPRLGWALALAESVAVCTGGRWPETAEGEELVPVLDLLETAQAFGPLTPENTDLAVTLGLFRVVTSAIKRQVARILEYLETLASERGLEIHLQEDLTMDELLSALEQLDVEPRDFFLELWRRECCERFAATGRESRR